MADFGQEHRKLGSWQQCALEVHPQSGSEAQTSPSEDFREPQDLILEVFWMLRASPEGLIIQCLGTVVPTTIP